MRDHNLAVTLLVAPEPEGADEHLVAPEPEGAGADAVTGKHRNRS